MTDVLEFPMRDGVERINKQRFMALLAQAMQKQYSLAHLINPRAADIERAMRDAEEAIEDLWRYCSTGQLPNPCMRYFKQLLSGEWLT